MDETDVRLLAHLLREPLASHTDLGRSAGLTRNAAKARLAKLAGSGVCTGVVGVPNPALFGREGLVVVFPPAPDPLLEAAVAVEEVIAVSVTHLGQLAAICYLPDARQAPADLVKALGPPERLFRQAGAPLRPPGAALSALEWRILEALAADARVSAAELAERTGLTPKTAARHRQRLLERGAARPEVGVYSGLASGVVLFEVYAQGPGALVPGALARALGEVWVMDRTAEPPGTLVLSWARSVADAIAAERRVRALRGVEHSELILTLRGGFVQERLQAWCRREAAKARELARGRAGSPGTGAARRAP